jgi:Tfp pilus assembly protein PilZ
LEEKRRFPRINLNAPTRCQVRGESVSNNTVCNNISMGGISFIADKFIAPSSLVMLEVNILSRVLRPVGKIVWSQPLVHSDRNKLGVGFLEFNPVEKNYLNDYINMQMGTTIRKD